MEKVALITAGGSGMGADSARALAADGFKVGILSSSGKGEALAKELDGVGITGTNKSEEDLQELVDAAMDHWGRVDVLVNSAGHGPRVPVLELTDEDWHEEHCQNKPPCLISIRGVAILLCLIQYPSVISKPVLRSFNLQSCCM
jgi:NAD(P)-dependent dehydrogenase (short-subunit alcohol dehydrogenase family)